MGLTKQYLRFAAEGVFGVVASKSCNAAFVEKRPYRFVVTGGASIVNVWDTRFQRKVKSFNCDSPAVIVEPSPSGDKLAVGHFNGAVSIYDLSDLGEESAQEATVTFEGHTSEVTSLAWDASESQVASGAKDARVIVWDVVSETGYAKLTGHKGIISRVRFWEWDNNEYLVTSSFDTTLKLWNLETKTNVHTLPCTIQIRDFEIHENIFVIAEANLKLYRLEHSPDAIDPWVTEDLGILLRQSHDRPARTVLIKGTGILAVVGVKSPSIEIFRFSSEEQAKKRKSKRLKKTPDDDQKFVLKDLVRRGEILRASEEKVKSIMGICEKGVVKILCCLPSNQLETLTFGEEEQQGKKKEEAAFESSLLPFDGHRKLVRGLAFSSDKTAILTASGDCFKVWNRESMKCILTIPHQYPVVCCKFCPGDRHFIAGSTDGHLILGDISTGTIIQVESSGTETVWSIDLFGNNMGFASTNGNLVQLSDFSISEGRLRFDVVRQLDVQDSILCVKVSHNMKFLAVGLLDSTVKIFYLDTLKFHLSMYGHNLPVVSIDISADSNLLVSCSGDKTVKIWGMDFGDCHCSMIHTDGLVGCSFIDKTHLVTSVARDSVNIYDADGHIRIQTIQAHVSGGATSMGSNGFYIATAGKDQTIRLFKRTQEILVLDDEREQEREEELEKEAKTEDPDLVTLQTAEGEKWADKVIEALDVFKDPNADAHPLMTFYNAKDQHDFLFKSLSQVKAAELQQSLMMLPTCYVQDMIPALHSLLEKYPLALELVVRCLAALMKFHLVTVRSMNRTALRSLATLAAERLHDLEGMVLMNKAALDFLYEDELEKEQEQMFREMAGERKRKRKRREKALKRAILMV